MHLDISRFARGTAVVTVLGAASCQAWKVERRPAAEVIGNARSEKVAVTMNDARWVVLERAVIRSDSIVGERVTGNTYGKGRTALALEDVRALETRRFSFLRTIGLGVMAAFIPSLYRLAIVDNE